MKKAFLHEERLAFMRKGSLSTPPSPSSSEKIFLALDSSCLLYTYFIVFYSLWFKYFFRNELFWAEIWARDLGQALDQDLG